jgi:hypothetical protein
MVGGDYNYNFYSARWFKRFRNLAGTATTLKLFVVFLGRSRQIVV